MLSDLVWDFMHTRYMIKYVRYMISNGYDVFNYPEGLNCALYIRYITHMIYKRNYKENLIKL